MGNFKLLSIYQKNGKGKASSINYGVFVCLFFDLSEREDG